MNKLFFTGASILASAYASKHAYTGKSYGDSCLVSFSIKNETVSKELIDLDRLHHFRWLQPHEGPNFDIGTSLMILVPGAQKNELLLLVGENEITFNCVIDDLIKKSFSDSDNDQNYRSRSSNQSWNLDDWNTLDEIEDYLHHVVLEYTDDVRLKLIGYSHEGRDIWRLDIGINATDMPAIGIDCGIHAREWLSPAFCLYLIDQLLNESSYMKEGLNWIIYPMLNPDGYAETWDGDRFWRKNRRPHSNDSYRPWCLGVDLNRNYDAGWKTNAEIDKKIAETLTWDPLYGRLIDECHDLYRGTEPFSEPETRAHMEDIQNTNNIVGYITYHSYGEHS